MFGWYYFNYLYLYGNQITNRNYESNIYTTRF